MMNKKQNTEDWGVLDYEIAWEKQLDYVNKRRAGEIPDTLIFVEHPPVFTIGARPGAENNVLWNTNQLGAENIKVIKTNRGGDITYHGPGQLVGYPIIDWNTKKDLHAYLRLLEDVLIDSLIKFDLEAGRRKGKTGIWIEDRKIAAIGVAVKTWITYHGFSLNINPNLNHFTGIIPCGITDGLVTSFEAEGKPPPLPGKMKSVLSLEFWKKFTES